MSFWKWFTGKGRTVHFYPTYENSALAADRRRQDEEIAERIDKQREARHDTMRAFQESRGYMGVMGQMLELKRKGL